MTAMQETAARLVEEVQAGLGGNLIGAVLFGSVARASDSFESDIDLLFVVAEPSVQAASAYIRSVTSAGAAPLRVAASTESYPRLKYFAERGDPFIRTIFAEGAILLDSAELLEKLRSLCLDIAGLPQKEAVVRYLQEKSQYHHQLAEQYLYDLVCNLELSIMAKAQALFVANSAEMKPEMLTDAADWARLSKHLNEIGWPEQRIDLFEALVKAHKPSTKLGPIGTLRKAVEEVIVELDHTLSTAGARSSMPCQFSPNPTPAPDC